MRQFFDRYYNPLLLLLIAIAFFTRIYRVHIPEKYMFDEVYHVVTAKLIAHNDQRAYEWSAQSDEPNTAIDWLHPPGAKLFQAGSMVLLGETSFAWRLSSVIFGTLVILTTARLALVLFSDKRLSLLAGFFAASDGLLLVQSRIAMNDIHVTFFMLQTLLWYWVYRNKNMRKYFFIAVVMAGFAIASKWSGVFVIALVGIFELAQWLKTKQHKKLLQHGLLLLLVPIAIYLSSYGQMWLQGKSWSHFVELHKQIWAYQTSLTAIHPYQSTALQWFFNSRPVWVSVAYDTGTRADIYAFGNPALFFWGALAVGITTLFYLRSKTTPALLFLFASYLIVWLPWAFSPRVMFFYHYTPAVPLLCIILAYWVLQLTKQKKKQQKIQLRVKLLLGSIIASVLLATIVWYPHWTQLPVSNEFADTVYFHFDTWR